MVSSLQGKDTEGPAKKMCPKEEANVWESIIEKEKGWSVRKVRVEVGEGREVVRSLLGSGGGTHHSVLEHQATFEEEQGEEVKEDDGMLELLYPAEVKMEVGEEVKEEMEVGEEEKAKLEEVKEGMEEGKVKEEVEMGVEEMEDEESRFVGFRRRNFYIEVKEAEEIEEMDLGPQFTFKPCTYCPVQVIMVMVVVVVVALVVVVVVGGRVDAVRPAGT